MAIIGIVAVDGNGAIGKDGSLPWHYSADLRFFKEQTTGHAVVMGRRTWRSLERPLPNRLNIVLSREASPAPRDSVVWLRDSTSALALAPYLNCDLFIIGGARVFSEFRENIERWIVTEIPLAVEGADTFMPRGFLEGFSEYDSRRLDDGLVVRFHRRATREGTHAP